MQKRNSPEFDWIRAWPLLLAPLLLQPACKKNTATTTTTTAPTTTVSNPPVGVVDNSAGLYVKAQASDKYTYYTHKGSDSTTTGSFDYTEDCKVASTETDITKLDIMCYVEAEELDLYFNGVNLQYNVPQSMCQYFRVAYPYYYSRPAGFGPAVVSYSTDASGNVTDLNNAPGGTPYCPYDYSTDPDNPGPNCCAGKYTLSVTSNGTTQPPSSATWGGSAANCLSGPAMDLASTKSKAGYPEADLFYVDASGLNGLIKVTAPIQKGLFSNLYAANYFDSTDYNSSSTYPPAFVPPAVAAPANPGTQDPLNRPFAPFAGLPNTNPFYEFDCFDRDREFKARIRLMVRAWDKTGMADVATSYSATPGHEPNYGGTYVYHDYTIWPDTMPPTTATPTDLTTLSAALPGANE